MSKIFTDEGIDAFIDTCLVPTTLRNEVMGPTKLYKYYLQFAEHYKVPQMHIIFFGKILKQRFHSIRSKYGTQYYCKVKDELIGD
jgi:hypothetical protein